MKKLLLLATCLLVTVIGNAFAQDEAKETSLVQICDIPLPLTESTNLNRIFLNAKHVYVKIGERTYGTPYTIKGTYFGGDALLYTDDLLRGEGKGEKCYNVKYRGSEPEESFAKRASCMAKKLSVQSYAAKKDKIWYPVFSYNFFSNNCGSMANYLIECAGGLPKKTINYSVGDKVEDDTPAKIADQSTGYLTYQDSSYGEICFRALAECEMEENISREITRDSVQD